MNVRVRDSEKSDAELMAEGLHPKDVAWLEERVAELGAEVARLQNWLDKVVEVSNRREAALRKIAEGYNFAEEFRGRARAALPPQEPTGVQGEGQRCPRCGFEVHPEPDCKVALSRRRCEYSDDDAGEVLVFDAEPTTPAQEPWLGYWCLKCHGSGLLWYDSANEYPCPCTGGD